MKQVNSYSPHFVTKGLPSWSHPYQWVTPTFQKVKSTPEENKSRASLLRKLRRLKQKAGPVSFSLLPPVLPLPSYDAQRDLLHHPSPSNVQWHIPYLKPSSKISLYRNLIHSVIMYSTLSWVDNLNCHSFDFPGPLLYYSCLKPTMFAFLRNFLVFLFPTKGSWGFYAVT